MRIGIGYNKRYPKTKHGVSPCGNYSPEARYHLQEDQIMKFNRGIVPALGLIAILTSSAAGQAPVSEWNLSEPCTYRNLAVFLIRGKDTHPDKKLLTLQEALAEKKIIVHETGRVNELSVQNVSEDAAVFIQAGDIVKGGRQDRVLAYDLIVPAQSGRVP